MERLNLHMATELAADFDVSVVGPEGCRDLLPATIHTDEVPLRPLWRFLAGAGWAALKYALRHRPAVVIAGSGLCAPFAWMSAKLSGARSAVYLHGLDIIAPHAIYRHAWLPFIRRMDICLVNSRNTSALAIAAGVPSDRVKIVHPGVVLPVAPSVFADVHAFRVRHGWGGRPVLLSVGRLTERKGLIEFIEHVLPTLISAHPDILLAVIGNDAPDALLAGKGGVRERIVERARLLGIADHVRFMGEVTEEELLLAYGAADVSIFPVLTLPGDVEGFGMVALESAAHGLPTVAYAAGGVPDAVADGVSGRLVPPDDQAGFAEAILDVLSAGRHAFVDGATEFATGFVWDTFGAKLREALGMRGRE
jgi:phosphatidylinositol alpha-1,6-mannosyltransferase